MELLQLRIENTTTADSYVVCAHWIIVGNQPEAPAAHAQSSVRTSSDVRRAWLRMIRPTYVEEYGT